MLVIKVKLWPGGRSADAEELGRAAAAQVSGRSAECDYVAVLHDASGHHSTAYLAGHDRTVGFWPLLARIAQSRQLTEDRVRLDERWQEVAALISDRMYEDRR